MKRFLAVILSCFMAASAAFGGDKAQASQGQSRTKVTAGDSVVVWRRGGDLPVFIHTWYGQPTYQLVGPDGNAQSVLRANPGKDSSAWDATFHGEATIPVGTKPGQYKVVAGPATFPVEVVATSRRKGFVVLNPGASVSTAQAKLDAGYDLWLNPGIYYWARSVFYADKKAAPVIVPQGARVVGAGAIIRSDPSCPVPPPGSEYTMAGFVGGDTGVFDGLTFDLPEGWRAVEQTYSPNATFVRCTFKCEVAAPGPSCVFQSCLFSGRGAGVWLGVDGGLVRDCEFRDTLNHHPLVAWGADHNLALVDNRFIRTDRGPVFQLNWNDVIGCLFLGTQMFDIGWSENGCESFMAEGADTFTFSDNLILHSRLRSGAGGGSFCQWDTAAANNLIREFSLDGGWGVMMSGKCTDNAFEDFEMRNGAGILLNTNATRNVFRRGAVVNWFPGRWNQQWISPAWYDRDVVIWEQTPDKPSAGNLLEDVNFVMGMRFRVAAFPNLTMTRCKLNSGEAK